MGDSRVQTVLTVFLLAMSTLAAENLGKYWVRCASSALSVSPAPRANVVMWSLQLRKPT